MEVDDDVNNLNDRERSRLERFLRDKQLYLSCGSKGGSRFKELERKKEVRLGENEWMDKVCFLPLFSRYFLEVFSQIGQGSYSRFVMYP